ncbi:MAG TPA: cupin domain-containing protein [Dehalococcoidia bacterium]|nr:cupin domain-containing protein [Dehalococcoidia bacterium]
MHVASTKTDAWQDRTGSAIFTGQVHAHGLIDDKMTEEMRMLLVKFSPGGRTTWHTHSFEQGLIIVEGKGIVASEAQGERVVEAGDVVVFAKGEKHWHGATNTTGMTHIAVNLAGTSQVLEPVEKIQTPGV